MSDSTAQASPDPAPYRGRFAPSPTGPLHFGSLIAAVGSYLEARCRDGEWLVRMEDVDELRNVEGAADDILFTLEAYGFEWDGEVMYQTERKEAYQQALQQLQEQHRSYRCTCSRRDLREQADMGELGLIYPGTCEQAQHPAHVEHAIRVCTDDRSIDFHDCIMGDYRQNLRRELGDFIVRRRDGLFAYQLAVVVDDAFQHISHVVRGYDLLDSTPRQIFLQQLLNLPTPEYCHLPIAINRAGDKLSKQTRAPALSRRQTVRALVQVMDFLNQAPEPELQHATPEVFWQWALETWDARRVPAKAHIPAPSS